jgi:hypothetical protein
VCRKIVDDGGAMPSAKAKNMGGNFWRASLVSIIVVVAAFASFLTVAMYLERRESYVVPRRFEVEFFRAGLSGPKLLRSGWHSPEDWGTWSNGPSAALVWRLNRLPASEMRVRIGARIYPWYASIDQSIRVIVNGAHVATIVRNFEGEISGGNFRVPASIASAKVPMQIAFEIANPTAPKDIGESLDTRKLGLGLMNIEIEYESE